MKKFVTVSCGFSGPKADRSDVPLELHCNSQSERGKSISTIQLVSTSNENVFMFFVSC